MPTFENTGAAENLAGTDLADVFAILAGDGAGADRFSGRFGNDQVSGGTGNDTLLGDDGTDTLYGGSQNDQLSGGFGSDSLFGGGNSDVILGDAGDDLLDGGFGADNLRDTSGNNRLLGGGGNDLLELTGTEFSAANVAYGGIGDDRIVTRGGNATLDGGRGSDQLTFTGFTGTVPANNITIDLSKRVDIVVIDGRGTLHVSGFENVRTEDGNDVILGNASANTLFAGFGNDRLEGRRGNDVLNGDVGNDQLSGGVGDDLLICTSGSDTVSGGEGADTFRFGFVLSDTPTSAPQNHQILDFRPGIDVFDMTLFSDATFDVSPGFRDCHFVFIDTAAFSGNADEVRFEAGRVYADMNQDGAADFSFRVVGQNSLSASDFLFD